MARCAGGPSRVHCLAAAACAALLVMLAPRPARAEGGFRLRVGWAGLADYFPGLLGNGYLATLTAPRGTEATQTYMVGLMDRTPLDIARPALLPGWNAIDFNPGPRAAAAGWLNRAALNAAHFRHYHQSLDLRDATLTTRYRYVDHSRVTAITVVSFISQAVAHLAVVQLRITPRYSGRVRLSFPLTIWSEHTPRFPLARLDGRQVSRALAAHGLSLIPRAPATPDRAALWYPGYVAVRATGGSARARTLWLEGKAAHSLPVAMAVAGSRSRRACASCGDTPTRSPNSCFCRAPVGAAAPLPICAGSVWRAGMDSPRCLRASVPRGGRCGVRTS